MLQDPFQQPNKTWIDLAEAVETAARFRRLFPREGFGGLSSSQLQVLAAIAVWPGLTPGQLAECLAMEKSSVSQPLRELEKAGLISTTADTSDRRSRTAILSEEGKQLVSNFSGAATDQ